MKTEMIIVLLLALSALIGCQPAGRGTAGASGFESGTAGAEVGSPNALGQPGPFQQSGMPDVNVAASRATAELGVSNAGRAELSSRAATGPGWENSPNVALSATTTPEDDEILLDRVRLALSSTTPQEANPPALSIQTLNNLQLTAHNHVVTLRGEVATPAEKTEIERLVRGVEGVGGVDDQLICPGLPGPLGFPSFSGRDSVSDLRH